MKSKYQRLLLGVAGFLLALSLVMVVGNLWGNGFTSGDERFTEFARVRFGGYWQASYSMAVSQGRFYQLFVYSLAQIPYLFHSLDYTNLFRILSSGLVFVAFAFLISELWGIELAIFSTSLSVGLLQTRGGYNPFHGLPLWFNTGGMILLIALMFYARAARKGRSLLIPSFLGFLAFLFYESFLLFVPVFSLTRRFVQKTNESNRLTLRIKELILQDRWILFFSILYIVLYLGFRKVFPSTYQGNQVSLASLKEMIRPVWVFSWSGIYLPQRGSEFRVWDIRALFTSLLVLSSAAASLFAFMRRDQNETKTGRYLKTGLILFPCIFLPNLLFALTSRYRQWVLSDPYYIGSYYSGFIICLIITLGVAWFTSRRNQPLKIVEKTVVGILLLILSGLTYANQVQANRFFDWSRVDSRKWPLVNQLSQVTDLRGSTSKVLCSNTLIEGYDPYDYWSYYLSMKTGNKIQLKFSKFDSESCDGEIVYSSTSTSSTLDLILKNGKKLNFR